MPFNHHPSVIHPRAEKRQDYVRIYVCVRPEPADVLRDAKDGHVLAWTRWDNARQFAGRCGMIVVNWEWFLTHYLAQLGEQPPAARIFAETKRGVRRYHAELDASAEEMRTLNSFADWEREHMPQRVGARLRNAKVWLEEDNQ